MTKEKLIAVLKGALIAGTGAALTYLTQWAGDVDFGAWTPVITAWLSVVVNLVRKVKED